MKGNTDSVEHVMKPVEHNSRTVVDGKHIHVQRSYRAVFPWNVSFIIKSFFETKSYKIVHKFLKEKFGDEQTLPNSTIEQFNVLKFIFSWKMHCVVGDQWWG